MSDETIGSGVQPVRMHAPAVMAVRHLSVAIYSDGWTHFHYKSDLPLWRLKDPLFFKDAVDMMEIGDQISFTCKDGGGNLLVTGKTKERVYTKVLSYAEWGYR